MEEGPHSPQTGTTGVEAETRTLLMEADLPSKEIFLCEEQGCCRIFQLPEELENHLDNDHSLLQLYKCGVDGCDSIFYSSRNLDDHMNIHKGLHICSICKRKYRNKQSLSRHKKQIRHDIQNRPSNVYWCDFEDCCKVFKSLFCLEMHREMVHHLDKICVCGYPACDVRYSSILLLRQHINISHLQHKFMCDVCWEVCSNMDAFTKHKAAHDNEREKVHMEYGCVPQGWQIPKSEELKYCRLRLRECPKSQTHTWHTSTTTAFPGTGAIRQEPIRVIEGEIVMILQPPLFGECDWNTFESLYELQENFQHVYVDFWAFFYNSREEMNRHATLQSSLQDNFSKAQELEHQFQLFVRPRIKRLQTTRLWLSITRNQQQRQTEGTSIQKTSSEQTSSSESLTFNELKKLTPGHFRQLVYYAEFLHRGSHSSADQQAELQAVQQAELQAVQAELQAVQQAELQAVQAELQAVQQAELQAVQQPKLQAVQQAELQAVQQPKLQAVQAELQAVQQLKLQAVQQAELQAVQQAELQAVQPAELQAVQQAELQAVQAELQAVQQAELQDVQQPKLQAVQAELQAVQQPKLQAVQAALQALQQAELQAVQQAVLKFAQPTAVKIIRNNSLLVLRRAGLRDVNQAEIQSVQHVALQSVQQYLAKIVQESGLHIVIKAELPDIRKRGLKILQLFGILAIKQIALRTLKEAAQLAVQRKASGPSSSREWRQHQTLSPESGPSGVPPAKMPRLSTQTVKTQTECSEMPGHDQVSKVSITQLSQNVIDDIEERCPNYMDPQQLLSIWEEDVGENIVLLILLLPESERRNRQRCMPELFKWFLYDAYRQSDRFISYDGPSCILK